LAELLTVVVCAVLSGVVLVETVWVLESRYGADANKIAQALETLLHIAGIKVRRLIAANPVHIVANTCSA
jgi:predicted nucleic-acid-binding protein